MYFDKNGMPQADKRDIARSLINQGHSPEAVHSVVYGKEKGILNAQMMLLSAFNFAAKTAPVTAAAAAFYFTSDVKAAGLAAIAGMGVRMLVGATNIGSRLEEYKRAPSDYIQRHGL